MSIDKEFVLKRFLEDPKINFYDVRYPNRKDVVESFDNDSFSHAQAHDRLKDLLDNLNGTYIVTLRTRTKKDLKNGGEVNPAGEYTLQLGNGSSSNASQGVAGFNQPQVNGIGYMEKYLEEKTLSITQSFQHQMEIFKLRQEIADLKKKKDDGIGGFGNGPLEAMMAQALGQQLGITIPAPVAAAAINGVGEAPADQTESEERAVKAITRIAAINPGAVVMLENLATTLELHPAKIAGINAALANAASGQELLQSFMVLMN